MPAGHLSNRVGATGPTTVLIAGVTAFALSYAIFAIAGPSIGVLAIPFVLAVIGIGAVETAQHSAVAAIAPTNLRGSAFGMLATIQSLGNLAASAIAGLLWTAFSPTVAFAYLVAWMLIAATGLLITVRRATLPAETDQS